MNRGIARLWAVRRICHGVRLAIACACVALGTAAGCGPRTLVLVDPCPDAGALASNSPSAFASCPRGDASNDGAASTLLQGLVGHWRLDDGASSPIAKDSSGNGNKGDLLPLATFDPSTAWVTGRIGAYALATRGAGYAWVENSDSIDSIDAQVTVAAWVYLDGAITGNYVAAASRQIRTSVDQYYHLSLDGQARPNLFIGFMSPGPFVALGGVRAEPVPPQQWTHLAGTYDGTAARLYVNGTLVETGPITGLFPLDTTPFIIGANGNDNMISERFPGLIDEVVLYNRALDATEIRQLAAGVIF